MTTVRRHAVLVAAAGLVACGGPAAATVATTPRARDVPATATVLPAHLWVQQGSESSLGSVLVLDTAHGRSTTLPAGVFARSWDRLYAVGATAAGSTLSAVDPATGISLETATLEPGFALPTFGPSGRPTGLSPDGRYLVLVGGRPAANARLSLSSFLIYDTHALGRPRRVDLPGSFHFDGISNSGNNLVLLEDLGLPTDGGGYHVRRYDLAAHVLDPRVIADKRTGERTMSGVAIDTVASRDGAWQFTVYAFGSGSPFVHAVNLDELTSFCIDLPKAPRDQALDLLWGLAASHDGRFVDAVNAANGAVVVMPVDSPFQTRSGQLPVLTPTSAATWTPWTPITAEAKRVAYGAAVISPDDRTLYGLGDLGIASIDAATLGLRGSLAATKPLLSLTMSPDGKQIYAATAEGTGSLLQIDTRDGAWTSIPGTSRPLGVLHVAP